MDDLEFRRHVMSDPKYRDNDIIEAINASEANSKFLDEALELDSQILNAMKVDVPDDLADKILFNQPSDDSNVIHPSFVKRAMALAASVAFAVGLLAGQLNWGKLLVSPAQASLANTAMEHVMNEKAFIMPLDEQVGSYQINVKMQPFNVKFDQDFPYHVYYLNHCGFGDTNAMHMVFKGEKGRVTLFVTNIFEQDRNEFTQQGMTGIVEPMNKSSMVIVGEEGEDVAKIAEKLSSMVISTL
ncbi:DUF3379 domain-containing protein [Vibrio sp. ZSDE26]|uniref:DUF3379 domain-containing protein n=1 Tax=Vibrio amylolyticus TaxID=2847292 RepID=A0A9X1XGK0_9VIBR|nr:DUF3379 domain-containing protein [Vibrio amylolyticus]MCK6262697.1 DUF3379 domain-containing protein [Vibrio amylolyticus]